MKFSQVVFINIYDSLMHFQTFYQNLHIQKTGSFHKVLQLWNFEEHPYNTTMKMQSTIFRSRLWNYEECTCHV